MEINKIGIIGGTNGLGKSFAKFFQQKFGDKKEVLVSGRKTKITNKIIIQECDLVIFAVPIQSTVKTIILSKDFIQKEQIWLDFTSIKTQPMAAMEVATKGHNNIEYCGMHPMFGPLEDISGQIVIYCPGTIKDTNLAMIETLFEDFQLFKLTAEKHDKVMGIVQCVSHFADFVLGKTLQKLSNELSTEELLQFSSPAYRVKIDLIGRIFAQNAGLYSAIAVQNKYGISMRRVFVEASQELAELLEAEDEVLFEKEFESMGKYFGQEFCSDSWSKTQRLLEFEGEIRDKKDEDVVIETLEKHLKKSVDKSALDSKKPRNFEGAIFGEKNSHTDEASYLFTGRKSAEVRYFRNIFEVFNAVESGEVEWGIVPFENSTKGSVFDTLDELFARENITIIEAQENNIEQNLVGLKSAEISKIQTIISHPQALAQSQKFCRKNCPQAYLKSEYSTAVAAHIVKEKQDPLLVAIASTKIAQDLGLKVLARNIQEAKNKTKFIKIVKKSVVKESDKENKSITSFAFWFTDDNAGNLAKSLTLFSENKINLVKLDSRRASAEYGSYLFFIDAEISRENFMKLLPILKAQVGGIKILGYF